MPLRSLGMWIGQAQRATASGERIFQVIDEPEEVADQPTRVELPPGAARSVRGRHVRVPAGRPGARRTSTSRSTPGTTIALIGHTGSGKTTLTSLVPRFYDVTAGRVHDRRRRRPRRDARTRCAARSASIAQDPFLFSATVRENIAFGGGDLDRRRGRAAARAAQAHEFIERLPEGLRHGDRRARDHALRRAAPADRDRARARGRPAHPDPRRRDRLGRRHDRGADPRSACARRCAAGRR